MLVGCAVFIVLLLGAAMFSLLLNEVGVVPIIAFVALLLIFVIYWQRKYKKLIVEIQEHLEVKDLKGLNQSDDTIRLVDEDRFSNYTKSLYLKDNFRRFDSIEDTLTNKLLINKKLVSMVLDKKYKTMPHYSSGMEDFLLKELQSILEATNKYKILVQRIGTTGNVAQSKEIYLSMENIEEFKEWTSVNSSILSALAVNEWNDIKIPDFDDTVIVKSRKTLENYNTEKYLKENKEKLNNILEIIKLKSEYQKTLEVILKTEECKEYYKYSDISYKVEALLQKLKSYTVRVAYVTSVGNNLGEKNISIGRRTLKNYLDNPELLMTKGEYNKYKKEQEKEALVEKQREYYAEVNEIIDYANEKKDLLVIKGNQEQLDNLIAQLFDRTVNSIKKIKSLDSEEWELIYDFIAYIKEEIVKLVTANKRIHDYYESADFMKIKDTCENLMSTQREFNEYIDEKVQSISQLFGTRVVRNETTNEDNYIRPYKKTITPFTAEVSATVFASAENNPLDYVIKNFYPNKKDYPEQIQKLYKLVEEIETLKDTKVIIDNYKKEYQQYLGDVPDYIMEHDESGLYRKLGFANVEESALTVEYKFSYTSNGGLAQRSFTVPMTEETIIQLIKALEGKLTAKAFAKEQRALMTRKLREFIKTRDHFTCCTCGNSTEKEPNLLLEIDHIIPVAKGGATVEENLQTLCWKCNRSKSDKILTQ